jgi:hypothetical protein
MKSQEKLTWERGTAKLRVATSSKRQNPIQDKIITELDADNIKCGGSGRKVKFSYNLR